MPLTSIPSEIPSSSGNSPSEINLPEYNPLNGKRKTLWIGNTPQI